MDERDFERLVSEALDELPEEFRKALRNVDVVIEESMPRHTASKLSGGHRGMILGLYQGVPLSRRGSYYGMVLPDKITIYRRNVLRVAGDDSPGRIRELVRKVVRHEIAHHFGISDRRLKDLGIY